jgi:hypothetical protein
MATNSTLAEHLLRQAIRKNVSEKLGSFGREIGEFTDGMSDQDKKAAKLMILEMTREACKDFCDKMEQRITNGK